MRIAQRVRALPLQQLHQFQVTCPWFAVTPLGKRHRGYKSPPASACGAIESLNQKCRLVATIQQSRRRANGALHFLLPARLSDSTRPYSVRSWRGLEILQCKELLLCRNCADERHPGKTRVPAEPIQEPARRYRTVFSSICCSRPSLAACSSRTEVIGGAAMRASLSINSPPPRDRRRRAPSRVSS